MTSPQNQFSPLTHSMRERTWFMRITSFIAIFALINSMLFPAFAAASDAMESKKNAMVLKGSTEQKMNQVLLQLQEKSAEKRTNISQRVAAKDGTLNSLLEFFGIKQFSLEDLEELQELSSLLESHHSESMANFAEIETQLVSKGLSGSKLQRHHDTVAEYESKYAEVTNKLNTLLNAESVDEQSAAAEDFYDFMSKQKLKKRHQKLDPNNLPWSPPRPEDTRKPAETPQELSSLTGISPFPQGTALVANIITPEMLGQPGGPVTEDLAPTPDIVLTDAIKAKALELEEDPVKIYNWVRNNIEFLPTYGSIQGADYTLQHGKGNAFDTSSLLIGLLRAANIPARYAYGTIDVPSEKVMNWVGGVNKPEAAQQILLQGGVPSQALTDGGQITKIRMEHVWVEAWVDYMPSRGAEHVVGDNWIPLDASFKQYEYEAPTLDISTLDYEGKQIVDGLGSGNIWNPVSESADDALTNLLFAVDDHLEVQNPDDSISTLLGNKTFIIKAYNQLQASLPYELVARTNNYSALPDNLRHKLRYILKSQSLTDVITQELSLPSIAGKGLSINYVPATGSDESTIASFVPDADGATIDDLPDNVPGYLIDLSAQFNISGEPVTTAGTFRMGEDVVHNVSLYSPTRGWQTREATGSAGEHRALGVDLQGVGNAEIQKAQAELEAINANLENDTNLTQHNFTERFTQLGINLYFALNDQANNEQSKRSNIVEYRLPSFGFFYTTLSPSYYFGVPRSVAFSGVTMDVPFLTGASYSKNNDQQEWIDYNRVKGPRASYLENWVPELIFNSTKSSNEGISAARVMDLALSQGQNVFLLTSSNISELNNVSIGTNARQDIINSVNAGKEVTVHQSPVSINSWSGSGYIVIDPETGTGGYIISGGVNGGFLGIDVAGLMSLLSLGLDFLPGIGAIKGIIEFITGRDLITNEPINRWIAGLAIFAGLLGGAGLVKAIAKATKKAKTSLRIETRLGKDPVLTQKLTDDFTDTNFRKEIFKNDKLVDSWKVLSSNEILRKAPDNLVKVDGHVAKNIHSVDELGDAFVAAVDKTKWIEDIGFNILRKPNNKAEYVNPNNSLLKWTEQHPNSINQSIQSALVSTNPGKLVEGKVADFVQQQGKTVDGFGLKVNNSTTNNLAGDIDVATSNTIIEVKKSFSAFKNGQVDKFTNVSLPNYLNPYGKNAVLYIDEPLTAAQKTDILSKIPSDVTLVNSLDELALVL